MTLTSKPQSAEKDVASRRRALAGLGAVGAAAAAVTVLPDATPVAPVTAAAPATAADEPGYRLTEHIKRYYATART